MDKTPVIANGHVRLKHCRHGTMIYLASDRYVGQSLDRYGQFSEGEAHLLQHLVKPGNTIVEVGANIGAHTIALAKATGPGGVVHAFEPQRIIHQILCGNVALNALSNVYTYHAAVGRKSSSIMVPKLNYAATNNFGGISLGSCVAGEQVPIVTIDSYNLSSCHLIKIDVEGMEGDVVAGAEDTIRRCRPLLYVENDRKEKSQALIQQIAALGYRLYWHLFWFSLIWRIRLGRGVSGCETRARVQGKFIIHF